MLHPTFRQPAGLLTLAVIVACGTGKVSNADAPAERSSAAPQESRAARQQPAVELGRAGIFDPDEEPRTQAEPVDEEAARLREAGQMLFLLADYGAMAGTYAQLCDRRSATVDDNLWQGHAYQLARNWPAACKAYQGALARLDAEIASTEVELKAFEELARNNEPIKFEKGSRYPFLKRAQEQFPKQWPELVMQIGHMELHELKDPALAAKTLSRGLRFAPELAMPLDQLLAAAETVTKKKDPQERMQDQIRALAFIVPLETQRFLAMAQEQLNQPASAFDTWVRVRMAKIAYPTSYATTVPAHLKELAGKLPQDSLRSYHNYALTHPDREPLKQREAKDFLKSGAANPFRATPLPGFDFTKTGPAAASLAKLPDGRLLMAYASGDHHLTGINLSTSKEGGEWESPWEFAHNNIFNTRAPSLVVDDDGEIWMLCLSQRLLTQRFASAPYQLWLTHSRDGREWTPLRVLQMQSETQTGAEALQTQIAAAQYQEIPQLVRLPGGRFGVLWGARFAAAKSPAGISVLRPLPLPVNNRQPVVSNTHVTFEPNGRCHLVFDDFGRVLYYTRSDDMQKWSPLQNLGVAAKHAGISMPQLLLEGDHAALVHEKSSGFWLQRGTIAAEGLELGDPIQITDHLMPPNGSRLYHDGDRVLIPAGTPPYGANLLTAKFADLLRSLKEEE